MYFVQLNHIYPSIFIYDLSQQRVTFLPTYLLHIYCSTPPVNFNSLLESSVLLACNKSVLYRFLTHTYIQTTCICVEFTINCTLFVAKTILDHNNFVVDHELIFNIFNLCSFYTCTGFGLFLVYYSTIINSKWLV